MLHLIILWDKVFKAKIFMETKKSMKSLKISTLEKFSLRLHYNGVVMISWYAM